MYDTLDSVFSDALKREGEVIYAYSDNTSYNVLFRRNSDTNKLQNTVTIYYNIDSGIRAGQLLKYKDKVYLSINQETAENDIYYKSDLRQTNTIMNYIKGDTEYNIPVYAYDIQDALLNENNVMSIVNGNGEMVAENSAVTRDLKIDDKFYSLGGYWKINNVIYKDNVIYFYFARESLDTKYKLEIVANDTYPEGSIEQFKAIAKADDTIVTNANITWSSSNSSIATVDSNGNVTFLANGKVDITASWQEHNVTFTKSITVTEPPVYGLAITGNDSYFTTDTPTLTAVATINGTPDTTATITWESSDESIATIDNTGKIVFFAEGSVTLTALWIEHNKTATKSISVTIPIPTTQYTCKITNTYEQWKEYNDTDNIAKCRIGGSKKPFMCHFFNDVGDEVIDQVPVWSIDISNLTTAQQTKIHLTYNEDYPLRCYLEVEDDIDMIDLTFILSLTNNDGTCDPKTIPISIISLT